MLIKCLHREKLINEYECPGIVLGCATQEAISMCLTCEHGKKMAAMCPFQCRRPEQPVAVATPAPETAPEPMPEPTPEPAPETPVATAKKALRTTPQPLPGKTEEEEIECLRNTLAYLVPKKYKTLGVGFVAQVGARFGVTRDVQHLATMAGLDLKKERGRFRFVANKAFRDFVKAALEEI